MEIVPVNNGLPAVGMREEDWPEDPGGIAALLARMDQMEADWLSAENEAAWRADLQREKQREKTQFDEQSRKLQRGWD